MPERNLIPLEISLDGVGERTETRASGAYPYSLMLATVLPARGVELHSSYLGHPGAPTQVAHLLLAREVCESETVQHDEHSLPVMTARRRCLYDHLQRLQEFLAALGYEPRMPVEDEALVAVER